MSTGYNHRRKLRKKLRKQFPTTWKKEYNNFVEAKERKDHPLVGTLANVLNAN